MPEVEPTALDVSAVERVHVVTDDGWVLRGERLPPVPSATGAGVVAPCTALCLHAMMASRRTLDRPRGQGLLSELRAAGARVLSFDLRGHGESGPTPTEGARFAYDAYVKGDLPALVRYARAEHPRDRLVVVGHSLGGHAALIAAGLCERAAPDAVVAIATNLLLPRLEPSRAHRLAKRALLGAWAGVNLVGQLSGHRGSLERAAMPSAYVRQFRAMYTRDRLASQDGAVDYEAALARVTFEVLSVASEGDRLYARPEAVERFMRLLPAARVEHRLVRRGELGGEGAARWAPDHMGLVSDPRCRSVWREIAAWATRARP